MHLPLANTILIVLWLLFSARLSLEQIVRKVTEQDGDKKTVYYTGDETLPEYAGDPPKDMNKPTLQSMARNAYISMVTVRDNLAKGEKGPLPVMMVAFWDPGHLTITYASSTVRGAGDFGYSKNSPKQVQELLEKTAIRNGTPDQRHMNNGHCAEIVCAVLYFRKHSEGPTKGAKMAAYGSPPKGGKPYNACGGQPNKWGCRQFAETWNVQWFGVNDQETAVKLRGLVESQDSAGSACPFAINSTVATLESTSLTTLLTLRSTNKDSSTVYNQASSYQTLYSTNELGTISGSLITSTASAPTATDPIDAGSIVNNIASESANCIQECIAGFRSCTPMENDSDKAGSVKVMDCSTLADCYDIPVPWQTVVPTSAVDANPENPFATSGPAAPAKINVSQASTSCTQACDRVVNDSGALDTLWGCLSKAQGGT